MREHPCRMLFDLLWKKVIIIEIFKLFGSIFVDTAEANKSISKTGREAEGLGAKFSKGIKTAGKWALGLTTAAAGVATAAFAATNKVTQGFDEINKHSTKLGVATDTYQEMDYWANQNGISTGSMERAVGRLNQRIGMAAEGNEKYAGALERLGVDMKAVKDGTMDSETAMTTAIQTLSNLESETEKSALAADLFGTRLARDLMPALQDGSMSFAEAAEEARKLGKVIDEDTLDAGTAFQDNMTRMQAMLGGLTRNILANLIPVFNTFLDWVIDNMPMIQSVFQNVFNVLNGVFSKVVEWIGRLINWLSEWFSSNEDTVNGIWQTIQETFSNILEFLQNTWEFIRGFWEEHGRALLDNAITIFSSIWETVQTVFGFVQQIIEQVIGYIVPWIQEKLQVLFEFWQENGDQIMEAVDNVFSFIRGVIEFIMPTVTAIIEGAWKVITAVFDTAIGVIMGIVKYFSALFTGDFQGMRDATMGIWESLWNGVKKVLSGAWGLLKGAFGSLWNSIKDWFVGIKDDAVQWGRNMIQGFIDGIKNMAGKVKDAAKGVIDNVAGFLKFWSPAEEGEGRFITEWGANMVDGFLDGVRSEAPEAGKVMNDLIEGMSPKALDFNATVGSRGFVQTANPQGTGNVERLLIELIQAVREGKNIIMDGREVGKILEPHVTEVQEMNERIRREFA